MLLVLNGSVAAVELNFVKRECHFFTVNPVGHRFCPAQSSSGPGICSGGSAAGLPASAAHRTGYRLSRPAGSRRAAAARRRSAAARPQAGCTAAWTCWTGTRRGEERGEEVTSSRCHTTLLVKTRSSEAHRGETVLVGCQNSGRGATLAGSFFRCMLGPSAPLSSPHWNLKVDGAAVTPWRP